jgi:hypothetical protein
MMNLIAKQSPAVKKEMIKRLPKMSSLNRLLEDKDVRELAWQLMNIPGRLIFPIFENELFYGNVSERLHMPKSMFVYVSNKEDRTTREFLEYLACRKGRTIDIFSEEEIAYAEEIQDK